MARNFERNQPVALEAADAGAESRRCARDSRPAPKPRLPAASARARWSLPLVAVRCSGSGSGRLISGAISGPGALLALEVQQVALFGAAILLPPFLFMAIATAFALAPSHGTAWREALHGATDNLFTTDESISRSAARLGRAVRRELDALNAGLDGAFAALRALETALENQIVALDDAGARAEVRGETIAARLTQESQRLESVSEHLDRCRVARHRNRGGPCPRN